MTAANDVDGARLVVLAVDDHRVLTVEYRTATGFDAHLPESGIAVHLVDDAAGTAIERSQVPVHTSRPPFTDLLGSGGSLDGRRLDDRGRRGRRHRPSGDRTYRPVTLAPWLMNRRFGGTSPG